MSGDAQGEVVSPVRLLIHGVTCTCRPGCKPGGVCRWVGCCRSPIESARVLQGGATASSGGKGVFGSAYGAAGDADTGGGVRGRFAAKARRVGEDVA